MLKYGNKVTIGENMLLEFRVKNFKSFKDEAVFNMRPDRIKDLNYSILKKKSGTKEYSALSSAVIYGPNAAGKTNIIEAMEAFKIMILSANVLNNSVLRTTSRHAGSLEFIPNVTSADESPTDFGIEFISEDRKDKKRYIFNFGF